MQTNLLVEGGLDTQPSPYRCLDPYAQEPWPAWTRAPECSGSLARLRKLRCQALDDASIIWMEFQPPEPSDHACPPVPVDGSRAGTAARVPMNPVGALSVADADEPARVNGAMQCRVTVPTAAMRTAGLCDPNA